MSGICEEKDSSRRQITRVISAKVIEIKWRDRFTRNFLFNDSWPTSETLEIFSSGSSWLKLKILSIQFDEMHMRTHAFRKSGRV